MSHSTLIIDALSHLQSKGLSPSVARLKGLLPKSVTMPEIIQAIQHAKSGATIKTEVKKEKELTSAERIEILEQQVKSLVARIEQLEINREK
ncbi:hypothetical protein L0B53_04680 [Vibrio sp. SS-MA-C1-2]|uniref:hypothetical protein n=1 Tax=Vibrio sp. SS-MA-C1-2 TaxID=2908646 RepID=UPI001F249869|nr:hypothetical protein [Vibrio sp. SS-MA-C1-2]UJF18910.1 hypothetical protein L0B53_04680 [Vibrio sp. SS-MA-C1-2]